MVMTTEQAGLKITRQMAHNLQNALRGDAPRSVPADSAAELHGVGAIWFGDWREKGFGSNASPVHNACISRRTENSRNMTFAPITRVKHSDRDALFLPLGTIPGGQLAASFLLFKWRLRASTGYLREKKFEYKAQLPECHVREMVARMSST